MIRTRAFSSLKENAVIAGFLVIASAIMLYALATYLSASFAHLTKEVTRPIDKCIRGDCDSLGAVFATAAPLWLTAVAFTIPYRAGFYNIGAEGQAVMGAFVAITAGALLSPMDLNVPLGIDIVIVGIVVGAAAGALWALGALAVSRTTGTNEVIVTLLLNFTAAAVILSAMKTLGLMDIQAEGLQSKPIPTLSPMIGQRTAPATALVLLYAVFMGLGLVFLSQTKTGLRIRALGSNRAGALASGAGRVSDLVLAVSLSGALAGVAGLNHALGTGRFSLHSMAGIGFGGIVVAIVGGHRVPGILLAGLVIALWRQGSTGIQLAGGRAELTLLVEGALLLAVVAMLAWTRGPRLRS